MTVKVICVYLMLSFFVLSVLAGKDKLKITEDQFKAFKGIDPCASTELMRDVCNKLSTPKGSKATFLKGYPHCGNTYISLQLNCGKGTTTVPTKLLVCSYKEKEFFVFGKGQASNHVMSYDADTEGTCYPYEDLSYCT